jgi:fido (protein-threonine AMPylation protein)
MTDREDNLAARPVHGDDPAIVPALRSFSAPLDKPDSPFYEAPGRTVDETWSHIRERMADLLAELGSRGVDEIDVSTERLRADHWQVFGDLFPTDAGRFRWKHRGRWEVGVFGVAAGSGPQSPVRQRRGAHPKLVERQLANAFLGFHKSRADLERRMDSGEVIAKVTAATVAGQLYAKVLRIHPFVDGNLRAAYVTLQAALLGLGLAGVEFSDHRAHNEALAGALAPGGRRQSYAPLGELIANLIPER